MPRSRTNSFIRRRNFSQRGAVLVISMIMLVVLTMLMISAMRSTVSEERMVSNAQDWNVAFQAAEAALRDAERYILKSDSISGVTGFAAGCKDGLCLVSTDTGTPIWTTLTNNNDPGWMTGQDGNTKTIKYGANTNQAALDKVAAQPRYIIEAIQVTPPGSIKVGQGEGNSNYLYRVTAVGFGASVTSRVVLQSVYRKQ